MKMMIPTLTLLFAGATAGNVQALPQDLKNPVPTGQSPEVANRENVKRDEKAGNKITLNPLVTKRLQFDTALDNITWSTDGNCFIADANKSTVIVDTKTYETMITEPDNENSDIVSKHIGFIPGTHQFATKAKDHLMINGTNQLNTWDTDNRKTYGIDPNGKNLLSLKNVRRVNIENEIWQKPQLLPDKKTVATVIANPNLPKLDRARMPSDPIPYSLHFFDIQDGSRLKSIDLGLFTLRLTTYSPNGDGIFLITESEHSFHADYKSLKDGKNIWNSLEIKKVNESKTRRFYSIPYVAFSPDGKKIALVFNYQFLVHNPQMAYRRLIYISELKLIDATTGQFTETQSDVGICAILNIGGFSHDGKMLIISTRENDNPPDTPELLQIWDTTTGKLLKQWKGNATGSFAPDRPLLVVNEFSMRQGLRSDYKKVSTIGFWDYKISPEEK